MKVKKIEEHINWSGRKGFTFWNNGYEENWVVIPLGDKLLARKTVIDGRNYETTYFYEAPRDRADEVEALYKEIIFDFVDVCYDNFGMECDEQPFCDFAGPEDYNLYELLDVFGVGYGTFLNDVFFQYCVKSEVNKLVGSDDCRCGHEPSITKDERLAKKVISRLANLEAMIKFADGSTAHWGVVEAHDELWYSRCGAEFIGGSYIILEEHYGHMGIDDVDGVSALRDAILYDLNNENIIAYSVDNEIMVLLGFCEDDFDSE